MPEHTPAPTPHRAVYGFSFYLLFFTLSILYVAWALLPTEQLGLTYLPDKYFAVYLPMLVLVGIAFFGFFVYPAINLSMTPNVDAMATVVDATLIRRADDDEPLNSWQQLRCNTMLKQTKTPLPNGQKTIMNCNVCHEAHESSSEEPIAKLQFMDLREVNKQLFNIRN